jgi:hypothetical protein
MVKNNSYMTIGIVAGLFTATLIGLSIASYVRSRKRISEKKAIGSTIDDKKLNANIQQDMVVT